MLFKTLDKDAFANILLVYADEAGLGPLFYDPATFALTEEQTGRVAALQPFYAEFQAAGTGNWDVDFAPFVRHLRETAFPLDLQTPPLTLLRPYVRSRYLTESPYLQAKIDGVPPPDIPYQVVGDRLTVEVVIDQTDSVIPVSQRMLDAWGMTFEEALPIAENNLLQSGTDQFQRTIQPGLFVSDWNDGHDLSRFMLPEVTSNLPIQGQPLVMLPSRNFFLVTGTDDDEGILLMTQIAAEFLEEGDEPFVGYVFLFDEEGSETGEWVTSLPPPDHPAHQQLHQLSMRTVAADYADQRKLLQRLCEKNDPGVFVGELTAVAVQDGEAYLRAEWISGVVSLLPQADRISFVGCDDAGEPVTLGEAPLDRVREVMGTAMEPWPIYPVRYFVRDFPTPEQLRQMDA